MAVKILSLGAGVQSTTIALMAIKNWQIWNAAIDLKKLPYPIVGLIHCAIFADTQDEPKQVYENLRILRQLCKPYFPIYTRTKGKLSDNLKYGKQGPSFMYWDSIPAYTKDNVTGEIGTLRRQCTGLYKVNVIDRFVKEVIKGLKRGARDVSDLDVIQILGLSYEEGGRVARAKAHADSRGKEVACPLFEMEMTRGGCITWLKKHYPKWKPWKSACVYCPFRSNHSWKNLRDTDPGGFARAVEVDDGLRSKKWVAGCSCENTTLYLHSSCKPLKEIFSGENDPPDEKDSREFVQECTGMCGV